MALINLSGTQQWVLQRVCNLITVLFVSALVIYLLVCTPLSYESWSALHSTTWFKLVASLALISGVINGVLAGWQIAGDYIQGAFNTLFNLLLSAASLCLLGFGFGMLWMS